MDKIMFKEKKAQLGGLYGGILTIVTIGILLAISMYVLSSIGDSTRDKNTAVTVVNETTSAAVDESGIYVTGGVKTDGLCTIGQITNASTGYGIVSANYTVTNCHIAYSYASPNTFVNNTIWNVSYTYTWSANNTASDATDTLVTQFVTFLPWLGIILLVLAAGVVLFFVIRSFAGGVGRGA